MKYKAIHNDLDDRARRYDTAPTDMDRLGIDRQAGVIIALEALAFSGDEERRESFEQGLLDYYQTQKTK